MLLRNKLRAIRNSIQLYLGIMSETSRKKFWKLVAAQSLLGFLDLAGVAVIGVIGALAVSGISTGVVGNKVGSALRLLHLDDLSFQTQVSILGLLACALLIARTLLSIYFTRKVLYFLGHEAARISSKLIESTLSQSVQFINSRSIPHTVYAVSDGVSAIVMGVIAAGATMIADFSLLLIVGIGLFAVDPFVALGTTIFFALLSAFLYMSLQKKAKDLGAHLSDISISANKLLYEVLTTYREASVKERRNYYISNLERMRMTSGKKFAEISFLPNISKYTIEMAIVLGTLTISATQFILQDAARAIATLAIFLTAGSRIAPAILRIQQSATSMKTNSGVAEPTLNLMNQLSGAIAKAPLKSNYSTLHRNFIPKVEVNSAFFSYENQNKMAVQDLSFIIEPGQMVAIVGSSGAGKTTVVDLVLGLLSPKSGQVLVSDLEPARASEKWPGATAYVPQDTVLIDGTIRENICLGFEAEAIPDDDIWRAIHRSELFEFVSQLTGGLEYQVGARGMQLSGGQRQRIGIARALLTQPKLIILDEATSALDGETELRIANSIKSLRGEATVIVVAHRLSTVRDADTVLYLSEGKLITSGTFEEVRQKVPDFDNQARLMGL
jgi:ABC-type multidrug transport system fused ATPase/permease subunit